MRFEVEQSPATTPSWKSNAWNRPPDASNGQESPKLKREDGVEETEWEEAGEQVPFSTQSCHHTLKLQVLRDERWKAPDAFPSSSSCQGQNCHAD